MAVNTKTELSVKAYAPSTPPSTADAANLAQYLLRELQAYSTTLRDLVQASPQASDVAPKNPRNGMIRYAEGAWATALGATGLYVYKAGAWTHIV